MVTFPADNLPTASKPWAREVSKYLSNVIDSDRTNQINNTARDNQLNSSIIATTAVALQAQAAADTAQIAADLAQSAADDVTAVVNNIYTPGTTNINGGKVASGTITSAQISTGYVYAGTITATQISAGTLTGFTIKTAASGTRLELSGTTLRTYNDTTLTGSIYGGYSAFTGENSMVLNSGANGYLYLGASTTGIAMGGGATGSSLIVKQSGGIDIVAGSGGNGFSVQGMVNVSSTVTAGGFSTAGSISGSSISGTFSGSITGTSASFSTITASSSASISSITTTLNVTGNLSTDGSLTRNALATGVSTTCTINASGQFVRTTSSERYKQDIAPLNVDIAKILSIEPKVFRLKEEVEQSEESRYYAGFIAEELDELGLDVFVGYEKLPDGTSRPDSVYYGEMTAALVSVIKSLNDRIEVLEGK